MKRYLYILLGLILCSPLSAQERAVENRPYADLRPFHFGILVGSHLQDIEFNNIGPQVIQNEDGTTTNTIITTDQDRWDAGLTVGVLGEFRLNTNFQFRIAPALYFGSRHILFYNHTEKDASDKPITLQQELKTIYVSSALDLIFAAPRFNNHRPYLMAGLNPMLNLSSNNDDYIKLKKYDVFAEVGVGCDFYLPYFKLRPELKFMFGLLNSLDTDHPDQLKDANMRPYATSIDKAHSKMIVLTFYFE
ncbi:MAG: PorT family protein [Prevotella sp.]|jgi:hypothetical protein|nr:PorT family protein [Prevotella sp.]MCI1282644.1 PorT family protein [Prevotella sp.]